MVFPKFKLKVNTTTANILNKASYEINIAHSSQQNYIVCGVRTMYVIVKKYITYRDRGKEAGFLIPTSSCCCDTQGKHYRSARRRRRPCVCNRCSFNVIVGCDSRLSFADVASWRTRLDLLPLDFPDLKALLLPLLPLPSPYPSYLLFRFFECLPDFLPLPDFENTRGG